MRADRNRRVYRIIVIWGLLLGGLHAPAFGQEAESDPAVTLQIGEHEGAAGETVPVAILLENPETPVLSLQVNIRYDGNAGIRAVGGRSGYTLTDRTIGFRAAMQVVDEAGASELRCLLYHPDKLALEAGTGPILYVIFEIDEEIPEQQTIPLTITKRVISDSRSRELLAAADDGSLTTIPAGPLELAIDDAEADEDAGMLVFTVSLPEGRAADGVSVQYLTTGGTATAGDDYAMTSGILSFQPDSHSATIEIPILDDVYSESAETVIVELSNPVQATLGERTQGTGTIRDNDELPALTIGDATVEEKAQKMTFTVTLNAAAGQEVSVDFATVPDSATAGTDYTEKGGTLTFPAGTTSASVEIPITFDEATKEDDEVFFVELSNPINAAIGNARGTGTIQNTHVSLVGLRRALGSPVPEPSTYLMFMSGLLALGIRWVLGRRKK